MKRKILFLILISIFSITLIGCGKTATNNNTNNNNTNNNNNVNNTNSNEYISEVKAKEIALDDAKVKENEVNELSVELDDDDNNNKTIYEVSFKYGQNEYDYDIDATNGKILNKKVEIDD